MRLIDAKAFIKELDSFVVNPPFANPATPWHRGITLAAETALRMPTVLLMIFLHIVDDYYLQGWLASAKQKKNWQNNVPEKMYKYDYIWALIMHSFSWSFMIMLPIAYNANFEIGIGYIVAFIVNLAIHAFVDDLKANKRKINLWVDQLIHMAQIWFTFLLFR